MTSDTAAYLARRVKKLETEVAEMKANQDIFKEAIKRLLAGVETCGKNSKIAADYVTNLSI